MKKLGIISGVGTLSGLHLYSKIINKFVSLGANKDSDYPDIILHNYPFKSTNCLGIFDESLISKELEEAMLPLLNCDKIIVSCNTLYSMVGDNEKFFNMPKMCLSEIPKVDLDKTLVLCSETSQKTKIFGNDVHYSDKNLTNLTTKIINDLISGNYSNEKAYVNKLIDMLKLSSYKHIILGCTELSLLNVDKLKKYINIVDSVEIVVDKYFEWHKGN